MHKKCCGGKGGWFSVPELVFHKACCVHDELYKLGGTAIDRRNDDKTFYCMMKLAVSQHKSYKRPHLYILAWIYYRAVRLFGAKYYNFTE